MSACTVGKARHASDHLPIQMAPRISGSWLTPERRMRERIISQIRGTPLDTESAISGHSRRSPEILRRVLEVRG